MRRAAVWGAILILLDGSLSGARAEEPAEPAPKVPPLVGKGRPKVPLLFEGRSADRLPQLMDRLGMAQSAIQEKQSNLTLYAKRTGGSVRTELFVKERLHDLDQSRAENDRIYAEFVQTVDDANRSAPPSPELQTRITAVQRAQQLLHQAYEQLASTYRRVWPGSHPPAAAPGEQLPPVVPPPPVAAEAVAGTAQPMNPPETAMVPPEASMNEKSYKAALGEIQAVLSSNTADSDKKADAYRRFIKLKAQHERRPGEPSGENR
jgi:hypothetical protein